ncbi:hypothetical protein GIB67_008836 [Kingdonia uniflora]|uniref:Uncharacterized protein n=1 Tax=Kingdonia uniflora TaxID=39325 RepID=A0A7J7LVJ4_9MAGN|nr:hypothetical protein GIB67_008836 [Kingdonia uniflora]
MRLKSTSKNIVGLPLVLGRGYNIEGLEVTEFAEAIRSLHTDMLQHLDDVYTGVKDRVDRHQHEGLRPEPPASPTPKSLAPPLDIDEILDQRVDDLGRREFLICWVEKGTYFPPVIELYVRASLGRSFAVVAKGFSIQFLTSGGGSKVWKGAGLDRDREGLKFYYDGQGFMSMQLSETDAEIKFYDVYGCALHQS